MTMLIVKQDTNLLANTGSTPGGDLDGSSDGRYYHPATSSGNNYWSISDCRPGREYIDPSNIHEARNWLRFRIPLEKDPYLVIDAVHLVCHWNPNLAYPIGHPSRTANMGRGNTDDGLYLDIISNNYGGGFPKGPWPSNYLDAYNLSFRTKFSHLWRDDELALSPAEYVTSISSTDFGTTFKQATIDLTNWVYNDHITMWIRGYVAQPMSNSRMWAFQTRSWLSQHFPWRTWQDFAPYLIIQYHRDVPHNEYSQNIVHTLTFEHQFAEMSINLCVDDTLEFIQEFEVQHVANRELTSDLFFQQTFSKFVGLDHEFEDGLFFEQFYSVDHVLNQSITHDLVFTQEIDVNGGMNKSVWHTLTFDDTTDLAVEAVYNREVESTLTFLQTIDTPMKYGKEIWHTIVFAQTLTPSFTEAEQVWSDLTFVQSISYTATWNRSLEHLLTFTHKAVGWINRNGVPTQTSCDTFELLYQPEDEKPVLTRQSTITFEYPPSSPSHTVTLPAPLVGNQEDVQVRRIQRRLRGGELVTYQDDAWNDKEIWKLNWDGLTDQQRSDLFEFLSVSLGQEVRYTDYEGRVWDVLIVNPNGDFSQVFRVCGHTAEMWVQVVAEVV